MGVGEREAGICVDNLSSCCPSIMHAFLEPSHEQRRALHCICILPLQGSDASLSPTVFDVWLGAVVGPREGATDGLEVGIHEGLEAEDSGGQMSFI